MRTRLLLIADNAASFESEFLQNSEEVVLAFVSDNAREKRKLEQTLTENGKSYETLNLPKLINEKAHQIRDAYVTWVELLGEGNSELLQQLELPNLIANFWHFSAFYEHNSLKTHSFHQLSLLILLSELAKERQATHVLIHRKTKESWHEAFLKSNPYCRIKIVEACNQQGRRTKFRIRPFLSSVKAKFKTLTNLCRLKVFLALRNSGRTLGAGETTIACTYFPIIDGKALDEGRYENTHYKQLQSALEREYGTDLGWMGLSIHLKDWNLKRKLETLIKLKDNNVRFDLLEEWIDLKDILKILFSFFLISSRKSSIKRSFSQVAVFIWDRQEFQVGDIFMNEVDESLSFPYVFETLSYYCAFKNIAEKTKAKTVFYFCEEHHWERTLCSAFPNSMKVGLQHTITPVLLTNYFRSKDKIAQSPREGTSPNLIGCVGEIPKQLLRSGGHKSETLFTLGAFRFDYNLFTTNKPTPFGKRKDSVVVALSILPNESECLIRFLDDAFSNTAISLLIKPHPVLSLTSTSLEIIGRNQNFLLTQTPLEELCRHTKAMLVTESSSCFYALNEGLPIIIIRLAEFLDLSPLSWTKADFQKYADTPEELRAEVYRILEARESGGIREKEQDFLNKYLCFVKEPTEYTERIKQALNGLTPKS